MNNILHWFKTVIHVTIKQIFVNSELNPIQEKLIKKTKKDMIQSMNLYIAGKKGWPAFMETRNYFISKSVYFFWNPNKQLAQLKFQWFK